MTAPFPTLTLGDLDLTDWSGIQYDIAVIAEGTSRGGPVPIEVAVKSWLQDGSVVVTQGYDNREVSLRVRMRGPDLLALAECESALFAELGKPNLLTWTPADGYGPPSVFVVVTSSMVEAPGPSGDLEEQRSYPSRSYNLRLVCEAFVRSADEVTVAALAASGTTTTLVDNGSATTNWTGTINGGASSPAVVSGAVGITSASITGNTTLSLTRTASITTSSTKYLVIDWKPTTGAYVYLYPRSDFDVFGDGVALTQVSTVAISGGLYRTTVFAAAASISVLRMDLLVRQKGASGTAISNLPQVRTFFIDNINRTDVRPSLGSARQQVRTFAVTGSAPSAGSLSVSHASNALGDALIYVWPAADGPESLYAPPLRPYFNSGGTVTADAAMVSGARTGVNVGLNSDYLIPLAAVPEGKYVVMARVAAASGSFTASVAINTVTQVNGINVTASLQIAASIALTTTYQVFALGCLNLPTAAVRDATTGLVRIRLSNIAGGTINLDEIWVFNASIGQLIWVDCGTAAPSSGGTSRRVVIDPADTDTSRPTVLQGFATDASDAYHSGVKAWGQPRFEQPAVNLFTVTTNTTDADADLRYFPRWHTHAAS